MADAQSIIALNIGSQRVTLGELATAKNGGLILKQYESTTILADPAAEMSRLPQIRMAVSELTEKMGFSKKEAYYAISGQSVFTRFVKLPALDNDDIEQLVTFEAQQHVPFPIDEVVWDWQQLGTSDGQQEVVLVAIKSDALDEINETVIDAGLHTKEVDVSPMALANAFRYNYGDLEGAALLIDIGARSSNLIYVDGNKTFTRTIAIGGATVTSAIAKEYNVPFIEAESQKCSNGLVALDTRHTSTLDELTASLAMAIRTSLNRMPAEIARTTNFFRSQHDGAAPTKVYLAGGGANLPMISEFFMEKLRLPVEMFNPLKRISVGQGVDVDKVSHEAHLLGELVGMGLRSLGETTLSIDLVPDTVQQERESEKRKPILITAAAIIIGACACFWMVNKVRSGKAADKHKQLTQELDELNKFYQPMQSDADKATKVAATLSQYREAGASKVQWLGILDDLKQHFAHENVWISDVEPLVDYQMPSTDPDKPSAKVRTVVADNFSNVSTFGKSSLQKPPSGALERFNKNGTENKNYVAPRINAIRVSGFWSGKSNGVVLQQLAKAIEKSDYFTNELGQYDARKKKLIKEAISQEKLTIVNATDIADGNAAAKFTVIIPLDNPILLK